MRLALLAAAVAAAALMIPDDAEARERRGGQRSKSRGHVSTHIAANRAPPSAELRKQSRAHGVAYGGGIACTSSTPPGTPGCSLAKLRRSH